MSEERIGEIKSQQNPAEQSNQKEKKGWWSRHKWKLMPATLFGVAADAWINRYSPNPEIWYLIVGAVWLAISIYIGMGTHSYVERLKHGDGSPPAQIVDEQPQLTVRAKIIYRTERDLPSEYFYVFPGKPGTIYPIATMMFIQVTNESIRSMMFDTYSVEVETEPDKWIATVPMPVHRGFIAFASGGDRSMASIWDYSKDYFNRHIGVKNLASYETMQGWIFLDFPRGEPGKKWRFITKDATGKRLVHAIVPPQLDDEDMLENGVSIRVTGETVDISECKRSYFKSDGK